MKPNLIKLVIQNFNLRQKAKLSKINNSIIYKYFLRNNLSEFHQKLINLKIGETIEEKFFYNKNHYYSNFYSFIEIDYEELLKSQKKKYIEEIKCIACNNMMIKYKHEFTHYSIFDYGRNEYYYICRSKDCLLHIYKDEICGYYS